VSDTERARRITLSELVLNNHIVLPTCRSSDILAMRKSNFSVSHDGMSLCAQKLSESDVTRQANVIQPRDREHALSVG
jgi:hypothetical protein